MRRDESKSKARPAGISAQLPHLETFAKAAELVNFTRTAEALGVTQAAVSQHVQALERELDVALFRRHAGRVELTDAGRKLYDFAQRIFDLHADARQSLGQPPHEVRGELRLAASTIPAEHFLTNLLEEFRRAFPSVHVVAEVADSRIVVAAVESGQVNLGLTGQRIPAPWAEYQLFATDRLVLIVPARHRWKNREAVSLDELRREPLIIREHGSGTRACLERALAARNRTLNEFNISLELGSNEALKDAVARGMGVAVLSIRSVTAELAARKFREIAIDDLPLTRELYVVVDSRRALPPPARALVQFLLSHPLDATS